MEVNTFKADWAFLEVQVSIVISNTDNSNEVTDNNGLDCYMFLYFQLHLFLKLLLSQTKTSSPLEVEITGVDCIFTIRDWIPTIFLKGDTF